MADPNTNIPFGYCQCGCGQLTKLVPYNSAPRKWVKGEPMRFVHGHNATSVNHYNWKGEITGSDGYRRIKKPDHPRAEIKGYVREHILIIEELLGYSLPPNYEIHHKDGCRFNNDINNLVVCPSRAIHCLIHTIEKALRACGHANWRQCSYCKKWDDPNNMYVHGRKSRHRSCHAKAMNKRYHSKLSPTLIDGDI